MSKRAATPNDSPKARSRRVAAARRKAIEDYEESVRRRWRLADHEMHLTALTKAFEALGETEKDEVLQSETRFIDLHGAATSETESFLRFARSVVPTFGMKIGRDYGYSSVKDRHVRPVESLEGLPNVLWHGSRATERVLVEGLIAGPAGDVNSGDLTYAWSFDVTPEERRELESRGELMIEWKPYMEEWYRSLSRDGRRELSRYGVRGKMDLPNALSMAWMADSPALAAEYSRDSVIAFETRKMTGLVGWFSTDVAARRGEYVLIGVPGVAFATHFAVYDVISVSAIYRDRIRR